MLPSILYAIENSIGPIMINIHNIAITNHFFMVKEMRLLTKPKVETDQEESEVENERFRLI